MDFIAQMMLESDSVPERDKLAIRAVHMAQEVGNAIHDIVEKYVKPGAEADEETLKQVVEYLALVKTGIMQFTESTPIKREEH
jgi:RNA 3'-terminal phosphate cyclase